MSPITFVVNGKSRTVSVAPDTPLLWVLRDTLGLTGTKFGCGIAQCGACTVHLDGQPIRSCIMPVVAVSGKNITTIEAIGQTPSGAKVQKAWLDEFDAIAKAIAPPGAVLTRADGIRACLQRGLEAYRDELKLPKPKR